MTNNSVEETHNEISTGKAHCRGCVQVRGRGRGRGRGSFILDSTGKGR